METKLLASLDGAKRGRRIGFLIAQSRAAELVLNQIKDSQEAQRVYHLIMNLDDKIA